MRNWWNKKLENDTGEIVENDGVEIKIEIVCMCIYFCS